ncbi:ALPHABET ISOFORM E-RELATED [Salix viminalis]|uniref:ALPHABET ISOFORM E-RELATED n=1 Tax=Salix viminalis TaxID=40686 RepID=A0A9Q0SB68_SALVM|nr:ALPHABET ISOFORM E-RELATED [Salix viminalis]
MADICCGIVRENEASSTPCEPTSRAARRRRMEIRRFKFVPGLASTETGADDMGANKKQKQLDRSASSPFSRHCQNEVENCRSDHRSIDEKKLLENGKSSELQNFKAFVEGEETWKMQSQFTRLSVARTTEQQPGYTISVSMMDTVAVKCKERLHELVREEVESEEEWKSAMERSFRRMDKEVIAWNQGVKIRASCRCEMQTPESDAVGSTAVVAVVTPDKIIVANCGDSRAVLCRNGKPLPLSSDHKPDRPDELKRIQNAGGRVIYWDGPRILGVLAMSRAIGDNYLKPYVSCEPEVTTMDRTVEDDCLILASDGLWDVVSNETACGVARMCLRAKEHSPPPCPARMVENDEVSGITTTTTTTTSSSSGEVSDKACSDASMLLTKLALARHSTDNVSVVVVDLRKDT